MVTIDQIETGVAAYADREVLPKLPGSSGQRLLAGAALSLLIRGYGQQLRGYKPTQLVETLGIFDADHNVDLDKLRDAVMPRIPDEGVALELIRRDEETHAAALHDILDTHAPDVLSKTLRDNPQLSELWDRL